MRRCPLCDPAAQAGQLCGTHAAALAGCRDLTPEQIVAPADARAQRWLIDQWGGSHGLPVPATIGRDPAQCTMAVLHHSVSSRHARVVDGDGDGEVRIVDYGSLNGTYVNGARTRAAALRDGDVVTLGEVPFFFVTRAMRAADPVEGSGRTVPTKEADLALAVELVAGAGGLVCGLKERVGGGVARADRGVADLAGLEFAFLRVLVERAQAEPDRELHFVSSQELVSGLDFRSDYASDENLRELVRRVRRKLRQVGADGVVESRRGAGYRLGWAVRREGS